ncbi:hypothetical protein TSL6_13080 [Sulfurovum sp. TSL6]|uniref:hypothetical protein n=1 Tax=Sulfurovum sp. TSL6 TaxID=2826995 RepID=UPI001CC49166|nr:hypothetical protein [Sulfurovum sp. TSL6]GIU00802.1 hypothetical protein TSL6_13080 [Sulfurovum sp. TSL6]
MYYILNETNQIIAADKSLLELCGLSHIDELSLKIALDDTKFDLSETNITITTDHNDKMFPISKTPLSSMLGNITLVEIQAEQEKAEEDDLSVLTLDDTVESIAPLETEDISEEIEIAIDDNELFDLVTEEETEDSVETVEEPLDTITEDTEILDLGLSDKEDEIAIDRAEESLDVSTEDTEILDLGLSDKEEEVAIDTAEILIDIDKVSQQIGVSHEDYDTFLKEYIDTALGLEQDLISEDSAKRSDAVATLSHLGEVLQLPFIGDIIAKIDTASVNDRKETVASFYAALTRITTAPTVQAEPEMELFNTQEEAKIDLLGVEEEEIEPEVTVSEKGFGTISLEGIKPIHFDFQLEEAANDLSLPVELIEEFVHDFIEQCHIETEKMLKAYEEGDLDAIQKIGHLLKGAASNLRINPLADTLYKIQFCEDSSNLEALIKDYWGHFLSFEIQINALAK